MAPKPEPSPRPSAMDPRTSLSVGDGGVETFVIIPSDGCYGWLVVLASFLCYFVCDGSMYTFGLFMDDISLALGVTVPELAISNSVQSGVYFLFGPVTCALINRLGFRKVTIGGAALAAGGFFLASFLSSYGIFIVAHGLMVGLGFGSVYIPSTVIIGFYFQKWRPLAMALLVSGSAVGTMCMPLIFDMLLKEFDWRFKFRVLGGMSLFLIICGCTFKPVKPTRVINQKKINPMVNISPTPSVTWRHHNAAYPTAGQVHADDFIAEELTENQSVASNTTFRENKTLMYNSIIDLYQLNRCQICCINCNKKCSRPSETKPSFRPMYRDDVFFDAHRSKIFKAVQSHRVKHNLHMTRVTTAHDEHEDYIPCVCCPNSIKRTLATMLDFSVLKMPAIILVALTSFFITLGFYLPFIYLIECTKEIAHMDRESSVYLITILGIVNAVARLVCGLMIFVPKLKALHVCSTSMLVMGISTGLATISFDFYPHLAFVFAFGISFAFVIVTKPLMILDLVGLGKLTNAFGVCIMFQGMACLLSMPTVGFLLEETGDYRIPYYFASASITIAAFSLFAIYCLKSRNDPT